jgi:hypothetical protein
VATRAVDIIARKRDGLELSKDEIEEFVSGFVHGEIPDYQVSAWAMAVVLQGMTARETYDLTMAMVASGETLDLSDLAPNAVDKHSTGGVGDKTTLVVEPAVAACGVQVAKMSGHGLGYSGGTLDKLESIPGIRVQLTSDQFLRQLKRIGLVLCGQTVDLAPADGKLYALRDVTATVPSTALIAASIMSKKIASGARDRTRRQGRFRRLHVDRGRGDSPSATHGRDRTPRQEGHGGVGFRHEPASRFRRRQHPGAARGARHPAWSGPAGLPPTLPAHRRPHARPGGRGGESA